VGLQRRLGIPLKPKNGLEWGTQPSLPVKRCEWSSVAGVRAIAKFQRGVLQLDSGQDRFVVLGVGQLSFQVISSFDDLCRNSFGQVAVSKRYLRIRIRSSPYNLVGPLG